MSQLGDDLAPVDSQALEQLRRDASSFEALVQALPDLYFLLAEDGTILDYRAQSASELYVPPAAFLGRRLWDVVPAEGGALLKEAVGGAVREGRLVAVEYALPMPTGLEHYEARVVPAGFGRAASFVRNITAQRRVADERERALSLLRATLDATADGILVVDDQGRIEDFNQRFVELWKIPAAPLSSRDDALVLASVLDQLAEPEQFLERVRALYGEPHAESLDILRFRDGRQVERYSRPQVRSGEIVGRVWSFRDVTRQREAEAALERALEEARAAIRTREEFLSIASHELRTPLTSMILALGTLPRLLESPATSERTARMDHVVDIALRQGRLLARLVDELLSVARIQAGRMELHLEEVDLVALTKEAVATVADDLARAACPVTLQATGAIRGRWDRPRLLQVVVNLLTNAARHAPGAPVRIRVDANRTSATLEVRDQGQGIPLPLQARIFERFERATPHGDQGGLGLGLYISMEIVRAHGGGLRVESDVGAGAAFIVSLPYGD